MTIAKVVLAFGRWSLAAVERAPLPAPMGPAQPLGDCGLVAAFDRALGATAVGPAESARLGAAIASGNSASDRAALDGEISLLSALRDKSELHKQHRTHRGASRVREPWLSDRSLQWSTSCLPSNIACVSFLYLLGGEVSPFQARRDQTMRRTPWRKQSPRSIV
jgi:hypothetical protein